MPNNEFPRVFRVRQHFDSPVCEDVAAAVRQQLTQAHVTTTVSAGQSVAITVGSRGITDIAQIVQATVAFLRDLRAEPFIVPAMGSHGGGTAEGQRQVIESYGVTEAFCGCPIRSSMETQIIGEAKEGFPIYFDRYAYEADHVIVCGRIKPHTGFSGDIQSGLMKMMMIGLGKKDGAALYHRVIHQYGFPQIIRSVAPKVLEHANVLLGLAIVENANDETAHIEAVLPSRLQDRETELLKMARRLMPTLPFKEIDVLLLDEIGKNVSGSGMDTNVIGRKASEKLPDQPNIQYIVIRGITGESHGNACGVGLAEFCLTRVIEKMDREATVLNCLTALDIDAAKIPVHFTTDKRTLEAALGMLGTTPPEQARLVWIKNTGQLAQLICSEAYLDEVASSPSLEPLESPLALPFGADGMLPDDVW